MPVILTIGTYDGVHLGHRRIIKALLREGARAGLRGAVAYFPFPPRLFFSGEKENCLITLPREREKLLRELGVRRIRALPFGAALAKMSAEDFFDSVILKAEKARGLCVGADFALGRGRAGGPEFLRRRCAGTGLFFKALPFLRSGGHKISSSLIRSMLSGGRVREANKLLGWNYSVSGKVVKGAGIGRALGFPTANVDAHRAKILPPGIFAARVRLGRETFGAVVNVGRRPTVRSLGGRLLLEAHLLDFDRMIYGRTLTVEFLRRLRSEKRFNSRDALRARILKDISAARRLLPKQGGA